MPQYDPIIVIVGPTTVTGTNSLSTTHPELQSTWYDKDGKVLSQSPTYVPLDPSLVSSVTVGGVSIPVTLNPEVLPSNKNNPICCGGTETIVQDSVIDDCKSDLFAMA